MSKVNQSLLSVGQLLERNYSLCFKDMSCTTFDRFGCELISIEMRDKSFPVEWKKKTMHVVLKEAVKLKNMSYKEEVFQNLKCDSNGSTTKVAKKLDLFDHNKLEEKKENKFLEFDGESFFVGYGSCNNFGHCFGKCNR